MLIVPELVGMGWKFLRGGQNEFGVQSSRKVSWVFWWGRSRTTGCVDRAVNQMGYSSREWDLDVREESWDFPLGAGPAREYSDRGQSVSGSGRTGSAWGWWGNGSVFGRFGAESSRALERESCRWGGAGGLGFIYNKDFLFLSQPWCFTFRAALPAVGGR